MSPTSGFKQSDFLALIALLAFFVPLTLLSFAHLDDNRLTSWQWVFANVDLAGFFVLLLAGVLLARPLARLRPSAGSPWLLFFLSLLAASLFWREPEVIVDASRYFSQAKHIATFGSLSFFKAWGRELAAWTDLPLLPFLYGLIFKVLGEERLFIQLFTSLLFAGTVVLTYHLGRSLWDRETGYSAGLALLAFPYLYTQVGLMLVDVPTMFLLALAVFSFARAVRAGGALWLALAGIVLALTILAKYSAWLWLSMLAPVWLWAGTAAPWASFRRGAAILGTAAALAGLFALLKQDTMAAQLRLLVEYQKPGLERWQEGLISTFLFQTHPFVTASALFSLAAAVRRRDPKYLIVVFPVALLLLMQVKRSRYTIPVFPMVALMASYGLTAVRDPQLRRTVLWTAVNSSLAIALYAYLPFLCSLSSANLREAGLFLDTLPAGRVQVFTLLQEGEVINPAVSVPLLDYFTAKKLLYRPEAPASRPEGIETSSLRFSWEQKTPAYYYEGREEGGEAEAAVVISRAEDQAVPAAVRETLTRFRHRAAFVRDPGLFRYRTLVTVFYD